MKEKFPYTYKREKQRFSIRKTKAWGACSVFLGTSILFLSAGTVARADTTADASTRAQVVVEQKTTVNTESTGSAESSANSTSSTVSSPSTDSEAEATTPNQNKSTATNTEKSASETQSSIQNSASSSSAAKVETTSASSSSAVKAKTTSASSSSAVKAETTSASSSSAVKAETTSAKTRQTVTKISYNTLLQQLRTSKALATDKEALTHVTKDNFLDYFSLNGSATYDPNTGIVTITPDENDKVGNFSLKSKIDMNSSFKLTGQVNLGNKTSYQGGADGIGFAFHNGNTTDVGNAGGNLGIGGLQNAIGFKLDTWHNDRFIPKATVPGAQVSSTDSNGFGWSQDPYTFNPQFGAFVTTDSKEITAIDENPYQRWWATTDMSSVQELSSYDLDGHFHDFVISYDGDSRLLTIKYTEATRNVLTWVKKVDSSYQAMAMIISASTGGAKNLQEFKLTSFDFHEAATVNVKYVDTTGHQLAQGTVNYPDGAYVNGRYTTTQLAIPNYRFIKMGDKSLDANGTLTHAGDNGTVIYVYTNQGSAKVTYIDDTTRKTLSTKDLTGDYGSTDPYRTGDTIADYEKQGYQLVSDNYPTNGVVYNQDGTVQSFEVHLTHGKTPVGPNNPQTPGEPINPDNPDGPKWPEGTDKSSLTQTVIRTVNYLDKQTGKVVAKQVTEQVTYNRTAIVDKVTGQIIGYSTTGAGTVDQTDGDKAWTAVDNKSDWDSVTSPDLSSKGYLAPDLATVAQQTVTPGDKDVTVNVYYDHDVVPVNPTNPQTPGTPINPDDPDSPEWPAGTDKNSLTTDVHQTIHYQYGDGSKAAPDKTDSTTFDHQVEIDKVTGKIVKDDGWTAENGKTSFDSKNSPVIPGYTASKPASDSVDGLTHDSKDNVQTIIYTANQESAKVTYIDDTTRKTLSTKDLTGDYGSTDPYRTGDTIADYEKQGYQLVSDNYPTNGVVYNQDGTVQSFEVHLTHGKTPVGPNNPQTPGEPINPDNPDGPKWPEGTDKSSLTQTVIRTVNYLDKQTGKVVAKQVTEQVTYNRTAIVDKVTGQIIGYSTTGAGTVDQTDGDKAWTAVDNKSDWDSVTSPDLSSKGYLAPDLATVAQQTVTPGDKDVTVNVYYDHDVVPVNPTNPQTPGTPINPDDPDSPEWPAGTDKNSLTTDVHQTIHYQYGDGSKAAPDKTDSTTFDHQVEIDKVTGKIVKDDGWTAENGKTSFDSKNSPVIPGYTASKPASDSVDGLTHDSKDNVQTIIYTANQESAKVTYIDDTTRKTLSTKDLTGDYGSTDPYRTGDTIADYEKQGYQLVSDNYPTNGVVYNQDGTVQSFEVHLTHGKTPVGPNNPQTPGEPINPDNPDGPKWPEGTDKSSLTQTVIRTVNYLDKQTGKVVAKQVTEQVTYNRTAIVDKVTGQIIGYSTTGAGTVDQTDGDKAWTAVDNKSDWDSVTSPDLSSKGYLAPDLATVAQQTVTPGDKDVTVNVYYDHDVVPVNPTNPQTPGTPINPDDPDSPEWPAGTDKNSLTTDVHQTIHYQYGDGSKAAPDKTDSTTFDHQVEIDKVTGKIVKDDGWTAENGKTSFDSKNSPVIPGYTASKPASDSVDGLTHDSKDNVQTIIYTANQESAKVTYIDDTTRKTLSTKDLTGDYGSTDPYRTGDTIADYEKQGYQLVSDNYPTNGVVYNQDGTVQSFEVHLTHGTTQTSESQTVNETIHYVYKNGDKAADDYQATPLNFTRTVTTDKVTGKKTYGSWSADQSFAAVTSPAIKGYTPDQAEIGSQTVSGDSSDLEFTVVYAKNAPTKPVNPSQPTTPTKPVQAGQAAATNFMNQRLPQTGETDQQHMTLSGLLLLAMSSLLGLFGMTKRQRKE